MLKFELLQSRFQAIQQHQPTTLDAFLLLTTKQINQEWTDNQKHTALRQFSGWTFDTSQTAFYLRLIDWLLVHVEQDSVIQHIEQQQHWYEQWLMFKLAQQSLAQNQLLAIANKLSKRPISVYHLHLLQRITNTAPCFDSLLILANFYLHQQNYDDALSSYQTLLQQYCPTLALYQTALLGLLRTLLARQKQYSPDISDVEYAFNILLAIAKHQVWNSEFEQLSQHANELVLTYSLKQGRAKATGTLSSWGRGIRLFGENLGKKLGGRESTLPYSKDVIESAPVLLTGLEIEKNLNANRQLNHAINQLLKKKLPQHEAAITALGLSAGSLWTYSQIDPTVLDAITFASSGSPDAFKDVQDIGEHTLQSAGSFTRLTGYVAEQQVAINLVREGHTVAMPDTANQTGWDLLVDGVPMQVKCSMDADYVLQHFEKYPDIAVITNSELANQLGDHPLVMIDPNLSYSEIQDTTQQSLQHLDDFGAMEGLLAIPLLSIAFAAHRNYGDFSHGRVDIQQYGKNIAKDVALRSVGAGTGKVIGASIGSFFTPVGTIFGAGIGAYLGGVAGGTGADALLREDVCQQRDVVVKELIAFARWFNADVVKARIQQEKQHLEDFKQRFIAPLQHGTHFSEQPIYAQFMAIQNESLQRTRDLSAWFNRQFKENEFYQTQAGWVALRESSKFFHQDMKHLIAKVNQALEQYQALVNPEKVTSTAHQTLTLQRS